MCANMKICKHLKHYLGKEITVYQKKGKLLKTTNVAADI